MTDKLDVCSKPDAEMLAFWRKMAFHELADQETSSHAKFSVIKALIREYDRVDTELAKLRAALARAVDPQKVRELADAWIRRARAIGGHTQSRLVEASAYDACAAALRALLPPEAASVEPVKPCEQHRPDEDGYCRRCGEPVKPASVEEKVFADDSVETYMRAYRVSPYILSRGGIGWTRASNPKNTRDTFNYLLHSLKDDVYEQLTGGKVEEWWRIYETIDAAVADLAQALQRLGLIEKPASESGPIEYHGFGANQSHP